MASIEDYYDNGVLKSQLAKTINDAPVPIYPRSSSDIISHGDSTVEVAINSVNSRLSNIASDISCIKSRISNIVQTHYDSDDIDTSINEVKGDITTLQSSIQETRNLIETINPYNRPEVDQLIADISSELDTRTKRLSDSIDILNEYLVGNFSTSADIDDRINGINSILDTMQLQVNSTFLARINTLTTSVTTLSNKFNDYYDRANVDQKIAAMNNGIASSVNTLRSEVDDMNQSSANDIKSHIDTNNTTLASNINSAIDTKMADMEQKIDQQTEILRTLIAGLNMNDVRTDISTQISNFLAGNEPPASYENADEEEY